MGNKIVFIAEIGLNHNGNFDLAFELIKQAKYSGADIVKFQLGWRSKKDEMNHITDEVILKLKQWADYFDIELLFSIFTQEAYQLIIPHNMKRYKIASRTVKDNLALVNHIVSEGKETIISLGMWDKSELPIPISNSVKIKYLWCKSKYPCEPIDLVGMPKDFLDSPYDGYSDHSIGIETCLIAISRGAQIIEKHFTLSKSNNTIRDHVLSSTPEEFRKMVQIGQDIYKKVKLGV